MSKKTIKMFNFRKHWKELTPFLDNEEVQGALAHCCFRWAESWVISGNEHFKKRVSEKEISNQAWKVFSRYYNSEGPWYWSSSDAAHTMMDERIEKSGLLPELTSDKQLDNPNSRYWKIHNKLWKKLCPKPNEIDFYQMPHGCHFIVYWVEAIIKAAYPKLKLRILSGDKHTICISETDKEITIFDIRFFEELSGEESFKWAKKGIRPLFKD